MLLYTSSAKHTAICPEELLRSMWQICTCVTVPREALLLSAANIHLVEGCSVACWIIVARAFVYQSILSVKLRVVHVFILGTPYQRIHLEKLDEGSVLFESGVGNSLPWTRPMKNNSPR